MRTTQKHSQLSTSIPKRVEIHWTKVIRHIIDDLEYSADAF